MNVLRVNGDYTEDGDILGDLMAAMRATRIEDIKLGLYSEAMMSIKEKYGMEYTFKDLLKKSWEDGMAEGEAKGEARGKIEGEARGEARGEAKGEAKAKNAIQEALRELGVTEDIINKAVSAI